MRICAGSIQYHKEVSVLLMIQPDAVLLCQWPSDLRAESIPAAVVEAKSGHAFCVFATVFQPHGVSGSPQVLSDWRDPR